MKILYIYAMLILLPITVSAVLVDGYCYLENQTTHDSVQIIFQADSPSAVTDTAYTDIAGYYLIDLQTGVYDITYSHQWYITYSLLDQYLSMVITLPNVTLQYGTLISGWLSGILEATLYYVMGDINIDHGDSLIIEPGTTFLFTGFYFFSVDGYLYAVGTEEDSIRFWSSGGAGWSGIGFWMFTDTTSILKYCSIMGSVFSAIGLTNTQITVENCLIKDNVGGPFGTGGIGSGGAYTTKIINCTVTNNVSQYGGAFIFSEQSHPIIENCLIEYNYANVDGGAADIKDSAHPEFINCVIRNNGPNGGVRIRENASATFTNCVIDSNWDTASDGYGIKCLNNASVTLVNTIVTGNSYYGINFAGTGTHSITYSDFYRNRNGDFGGTVPPFLGQLVTTNLNGDSCDIYYNIFQPPEFVDPVNGNYNLQAISPCIDAGDPDSPLDPDSTIADIGAFYFDQTLPVVQDLVITIEGSDVVLNWSEAASATVYNIYRSSDPYASISTLFPIATTNGTTFTDVGVLSIGSWFYMVTYVNER